MKIVTQGFAGSLIANLMSENIDNFFVLYLLSAILDLKKSKFWWHIRTQRPQKPPCKKF